MYYTYDKETLQNIKAYNSDIKIILCLRDPADAAISNHSYVKNSLRASDFDDDILREVSKGSYLHTKYCYSAPLELIDSIFNAANVHIVFFNDIKGRPAEVLHSLYNFLGVNASFEASDSGQKVYATAQLGSTKLTKVAKPFVSTLRRVGAHSLVDSMHNTLIRRLPAAKNQQTYDEKTRNELRRLYAEDTARTAALLEEQGLQLPWA